MSRKAVKWTIVNRLHILRLIYRSGLFLAALITYILYRVRQSGGLVEELERRPVILVIIWSVFIIEMIFRFFPSRYESPGCQKQFAGNYIRSGKTDIRIHDNNATVLTAMIWLSLNGIFGIFYMTGLFDDGIMVLISCAYSVCDVICILFFCPFQTFFLKNKCCCTCRIYNWDYAMMFTPLFFVKNLYGWSLLGLSVLLLLRWEITFYRHPERFSEETNDYLKCANCSEKLCHNKRQLQKLWKEVEKFTEERMKKLRG